MDCGFWQCSLMREVYISSFELKLNICSERFDFSRNELPIMTMPVCVHLCVFLRSKFKRASHSGPRLPLQ